MEHKWQQYSTNNSLDYFTDETNIPNQELVRDTINYFQDGPGARAFEPLTLLNLLCGQKNYISIHKDDPEGVRAHLASMLLSPLERHVLYGFILKWTGGYPVNNLDEQMDAVLKGVEKVFLSYQEDTPEKAYCKADMGRSRQFRRLETLFNTHFRTGAPISELEKQIFGKPSPQPSENFKRFEDLYNYSLKTGLLPSVPSLQQQGLQSARLESGFQDWLAENRGWHYADLTGLHKHLTIENFTQFLQADKQNTAPVSQLLEPPQENTQAITNQLAVDAAHEADIVFVTYSWESEEHNGRVISLTDHLRKNEGYNAQMDKLILQQQTAADLQKMMYATIQKASKVIIVLSRGYKQKAENYQGGVGIEYSIISKDIEEHPQKYILASFEPYSIDIMPFAFKGRVVTALTSQDGMDELVRKLSGVGEYDFSPINRSKRVLPSKPIEDLVLIEKFSGNGPEVGDQGPWDGFAVRTALISAIESNDTDELKKLLQQNSFLFYELVARKDFQQPIFYDVPLGKASVADFVWVNDNSDGPEWVLVKIAEPCMEVMEGNLPSPMLSRTIETVNGWERYLSAHPEAARKIFGAVARYRLVVVAGTTEAWNRSAAMTWRSDHNKNGRVEIRSSSVFVKSIDHYQKDPDAFYGPRQYPLVLPASRLNLYWNSYGYMQQMVKLFRD